MAFFMSTKRVIFVTCFFKIKKLIMRYFLIVLIALAVSLTSVSENWVNIDNSVNSDKNIQLVSSSITKSELTFQLDGFWYEEVETELGTAWKVYADNGYPILKHGAPELPLYAVSLVIPNNAGMDIRVKSSQYQDFENILVSPSKGNLYRNVDPSTVDLVYGKQYTVDKFYPYETVALREPYIVRDVRGQTVLVQPFQYNPVTKTLRVYYNIEFEVVESGISNINTLVNSDGNINTYFEKIYNRHFINYSQSSRYTPVEEIGNMLIISYGDFIDEMDPYIDWKVKSGTPVEIVDVATIGGASDIETFIENYYNDNGLTFVLLVGDAAQVPSSSIGGNDSDVAYSYIEGNDHYPDIFVGRFSAETGSQVETQVQRILDYEKFPIADTAWYSKSIGIASNQGPGDDNEMDYEHIRNISDLNLLPFTYNYDYEFFDGSQGGNDAGGNPNPGIVSDAVNSGATIINYTGHGSNTSWGTSGFSNNNVNNLTNNGKLPFIISVACVNGNFVNTTCFAEAWMRAENNEEPSGAIATLMSTINQSWNPPMRGQDEMNDILTESYSNNIKRTFGGITMNGCMNMNDVYGSGGDVMTDTWTIFGDPSLEVRTAPPVDLVVSHPSSLFLGATSMNITCDADGAMATLSMDGEILGTVIVSGGSGLIEFDALTQVGTADIVVTSFNAIPYISTVDIVPADGPFVVYANNIINDASGNNNGMMDYNENILLTVGLTNVGADPATSVTAVLSTTSPYIELLNSEAIYGDIPVGDTVSVTDGFEFNVANNIPDAIIAHFTITASDQEGNTWESSFMITGHAPLLEFSGFEIDDSNGNGNGKIEPGENFDFILDIANNGSADAYNVLTELSSQSPYIEIETSTQNAGDITALENIQVIFNITADITTPEGTFAIFEVLMNADHDITGSGEFSTIIGQKPILILNLANSASSDSMAFCFQELQVGYDLETNWSEDIELYQSVFILLGIYPNNYILDSGEGEAIKNYLENGGRVYMEGGDTWAFDEQTSGHDMFHIEGISDGFGDLSEIEGEAEGIMYGYFFDYEGVNSYIDRLAPKDGGTLIYSNILPEYGIGVSYESPVYKTIGTSFEFGGLMDGQGSTKDGMMAEILYFFDLDYTWTSIDDNNFDGEVVVYPNPATKTLNFDIRVPGNDVVSLELYNIHGQKVMEVINKEFISTGIINTSVSVGELVPGVYFWSLTGNNGKLTDKILISR